jgi:hypothetical protein
MVSLLVTDLINFSGIPFLQQWGIYTTGGSPAVTFDNVLSVEQKKDYSVADYPLEQGAFESYNKVELPGEYRVMFSSGGSFANRQALLDSIQAIQGDLKTYAVVTPEKTFPKANITHVDWNRRDGRAGLIKVEIHLIEIRNTVSASLGGSNPTGTNPNATPISDPTDPASASGIMGGQVQTDAYQLAAGVKPL